MRTLKAVPGAAISLMSATAMVVGCERPPLAVESVEATRVAVAGGAASVKTAASGTFSQSAITSLDVRAAGPNTLLEQTAQGSINGTLSGPFEDQLMVVIHPNGKFNAHFTITCRCTVDGKQGVVEIVAGDTGELVSPTLAVFAGRAVVNGGTGELSGLRGVLRIDGTVDVTTGLATYNYAGDVHFDP